MHRDRAPGSSYATAGTCRRPTPVLKSRPHRSSSSCTPLGCRTGSAAPACGNEFQDLVGGPPARRGAVAGEAADRLIIPLPGRRATSFVTDQLRERGGAPCRGTLGCAQLENQAPSE